MTIRRFSIRPLYSSLILVFLIVNLTPVFNPASAASDLKISLDLPVQTSNIEPALFPGLPSLHDFIGRVKNGSADELVGIYVPGIMALPIVNQPKGNYGFVSQEQNVLTLFSLAEMNNSIGLLAHNDLAGKDFNKLLPFMRVIVIYGNGKLASYSINDVKYYHAFDPYSPYSKFEDVENMGVRISAEELFNQMYGVSDQLVFQTCISANGEPAWGRLFVTAQQVEVVSTVYNGHRGGIEVSAQ